MPKLIIKNLSKSFGDTKVLDDINLSVNEGEFVVLVGPSGSGKSTILRLIAGLEESSEGEILINNKIVNDFHPKDRDVAMVFQNYALYPHMNVYDNLAFPLKMKKEKKEQIQKAVDETAELLHIRSHLYKKPKELSGGERQRVALGRAIIRKPQLFLMDEPLSNLDAKLRTIMRGELLKLHKTFSTTVVYVTHDQIEALTMGSKIAVLNNGKIQQIGTPHDVYNKPANIFVAGFLGSPGMNLFDFKLIDDSTVLFQNEVVRLKHVSSRNLFGKDLILGIKPEQMILSQTGDINFSASVDLVEMLGNEYLIYATPKIYKGKNPISIKLPSPCDFKPNDEITVSIDFKKVHYFDKTSGERINL